MQIKEIRVSCKRLVALKKFENVTFECEVAASVEPNDNSHEVYDNLLKFVKSKINAELDRIEGIVIKTPVEEDYIPSAK